MSTDVTPRNMQLARDAADLRIQGYTWDAISEAVGVSTVSLYKWRKSSWWPGLMQEMMGERVSYHLVKARENIFQAIEEGDVRTSKWFMERFDPALAGAKITESEPRAAKPISQFTNKELQELIVNGSIAEPESSRAKDACVEGQTPTDRLRDPDAQGLPDELASPSDS